MAAFEASATSKTSSKTRKGTNPSTVQPSVTDNPEKDWKQEYNNLSLRFNALSDNFKKAKAALEKRKDERDNWARHAEALATKVRAAEKEHGIQIIDKNSTPKPERQNLSFDASRFGQDVESLHSVENVQTNPMQPATEALTNPGEVISPVIPPDAIQEEAEYALPPLPKSNNTDTAVVKCEFSSDTPMVISERVVKKRRRSNSAELVVKRKLKIESHSSSSPSGSSDHLNLQESPDLGDALVRLSTPRKRKIWQDPRPFQNEPVSAANMITPTHVTLPKSEFLQTAQASRVSSALTPLSVNRRLIRSGGERLKMPLKTGLGNGIASLAEDGGVYETDASASKRARSRATTASKASRLNRLLNSKEDASESPSVLRTRSQSAEADRPPLPIPKRRELPFNRETRQPSPLVAPNATSITKKPVAFTKSPLSEPSTPSTRKPLKASKLRTRLVGELRLEDFKVNPSFNDGHDFAFSEIVRGDERDNLPGCVDMHCCGPHFRALAKSQRPNSPLTATEQREEQELLEKYLGDSSRRLSGMNKEQRMALWVDAKTKELADKYGRHRHRFSRMQSPPGFWNADFPTTQELEADRLEAAERERAIVEERYREAMRPEGRWLFRDE
ncbi:hypothetical protein S40288_05840 [Stachybotrys chartarum IBT 40288]|nr:hypothetical protein S40288_05840 [Stachybotrys chartarum IBT 40288]